MPEYKITLDDIKGYLDNAKEYEIVGKTCNATGCLVASALAYKYSGGTAMISPHMPLATLGGVKVDCPNEVFDLAKSFDDLIFKHLDVVTKAELRQHMPELFEY